MQTPKGRTGSSETPQKVSPRLVRQLNTTALESKSGVSSSQTVRTPKERSPKVIERKSPRSPASEKKRPSRISELESQVLKLQEELKKTKDQLGSSESCKTQALRDVEDSRKELLAVTSKLEVSQKQLLELSSASEECQVPEPQKIVPVQKKNPDLASAVDEVAGLEGRKTETGEPTHVELENLKKNLMETLSLAENMNSRLTGTNESGCGAHILANETLMQLKNAKRSVEALLREDCKYSEVERPEALANSSEKLVDKLNAGVTNEKKEESQDAGESNRVKEEVCLLKSEVGRLRSALEISEAKLHEEQVRHTVEIKTAYELVEKVKLESSQREVDIEVEMKRLKSEIEELKANMMDKETELQGISEENEDLRMKLKKNSSSRRESELANEVKRLKDVVEHLKANLMDKETEFQNISEENEALKSQINQRETVTCQVNNNDVAAPEVETARAAEREALRKLGLLMEEAEKSKKGAARVTEQLEAAQAVNAETEAELRRLKVQSDQWRKAAEAAAAMLSAGNNNNNKGLMERTGSLDSSYNAVAGRLSSSPYTDDVDDDLMKKKNGNVLRKIGVLWKKPQK